MYRASTSAGALMIALGIMIVGNTPAQATSGGCFIPSLAASEFVSDYSDALGGFSPVEKTCQKQCKDMGKGCKKAVSAADSCVKALVGALFKGEGRACDDGEDKKTCKNELKDDQGSFKESLKEDTGGAKDFCKAEEMDCSDSCGIE